MRTRLTPCFALAFALVLLVVASPAAGSCLDCFGSTPTYCGGTGNDSYSSIPGEVLAGNDGDDTLNGSNFGAEKVCGNQDNDTVSGLAGNDHVSGNGDTDTVQGNAGNDYLDGGNGSIDFVVGGIGTDTCTRGEVYNSCENIV